jgi:hypothetical protein
MDITHEFQTEDGQRAQVTLRNTMRQDIRFRLMEAKFANEKDHADYQERSNFCWFAARVIAVDGIDWRPVDESASEEKFKLSYYGLSDLVDDVTFLHCAMAVSEMKSRTDAIEKPDSALTPDEEADPN